MAVTAYTGRPGAGKSYAMVEQVIIPAVCEGRRVLTNIEGVDPAKIEAFAVMQGVDPDEVGKVCIFDGKRATEPGFWPTEASGDSATVVKGGDLIVFDEWRLHWPNNGKLPSADLEPFLRWHRHLTDANGQSCDVVIGTQLITDIHRNFRGLVHRSYKFKKLDAVGASKAFAWHVFEGHLQPKDGHYSVGNGRYRPEIFALYSSYAGGKGKESGTDKRGGFFTRGFILLGILAVLFIGWGCWAAVGYFGSAKAEPIAEPSTVPQGQVPEAQARPTASTGAWRIVGTLWGEKGLRVAVSGPGGVVRYLPPDNFKIDADGRAVAGVVEGQQVVAEDRFEASDQSAQFAGVGL